MQHVLSFVQSCVTGALGASECGPVWQLLVIAALLAASITTLLVMRLRAHDRPTK